MFHTPRQVWQLEDTLAWERAEAEEALAAAETEAAEAEQAGLDAARELREAVRRPTIPSRYHIPRAYWSKAILSTQWDLSCSFL